MDFFIAQNILSKTGLKSHLISYTTSIFKEHFIHNPTTLSPTHILIL